jgi:hypothetical protein
VDYYNLIGSVLHFLAAILHTKRDKVKVKNCLQTGKINEAVGYFKAELVGQAPSQIFHHGGYMNRQKH